MIGISEFVKSGGEPFSCSICHGHFAKLNSLGDHVITVHVLKKMLRQRVVNLCKKHITLVNKMTNDHKIEESVENR